MGEKLDEFEQFHPERMASRILGMGDVMTLIEKAEDAISQKDAEAMAKKLQENIQQKFRNIMITDKVEIEKINLEYVPVLKNVEKGEYELKPMFVCMARQNIEHSTDKEDNGLIGDSSIFPIIFDAQTGMEIQIGGTY